eukprot:TRINITY_DN8010_c0_g1_i1.p2 TRINITY_DN8010_c0_g1~~TRINITY_DN8010_c0_g1_i1.p2  ORF type:complete len:111 (-),score=24.18 TRINITY_DN8010_c0_g1_i1:483-785(-)
MKKSIQKREECLKKCDSVNFFKIGIVGDRSVGKTTLANALCGKPDTERAKTIWICSICNHWNPATSDKCMMCEANYSSVCRSFRPEPQTIVASKKTLCIF